jgi:hypothetical protein
MHYLVRMKVFLLCCLLVIGINVMLVMGGFVAAGPAPGKAVGLTDCSTGYSP